MYNMAIYVFKKKTINKRYSNYSFTFRIIKQYNHVFAMLIDSFNYLKNITYSLDRKDFTKNS